MNVKKYIIGGLGVVTMLGAGLTVLAQDTATTTAPLSMPQQVVQIGPGGRTLLRGTITAVNTSSLTVKSWGGDWVVTILPSTKLMPGSDMSQFKVGDFVGAQGVTSATAAFTVEASLVRDWTAREVMGEAKKDVRDAIKATMPRNWQGVVSNINATAKTFSLTIEGTTYSIVLTADAKVVGKNYLAIDFSSINNGDTVRVYGPVSGTTITASVVRDISL